MVAISNAEKQARFRKKEELSRYVGQVFKECQIALPRGYAHTRPAEVEAQLRSAAELPTRWTDKDLERAYRRVENIRLDVFGTEDPIGMDVHEGRNADDEFIKTPNPRKWMDEMNQAKRDTFALAGHLISALEISLLRNEDRAAALMEAVRHVGRALANSGSNGQSDAMTVCLAAVNSHHERPAWFIERFTKWLGFRLDDDARKAVGERLLRGGF
jgi:hypothetical protein